MASGAAARATGASPSTPRLSIGQVLQRLAGEFPELSSSKLRFFEDKGLLRPARTSTGYRKYSQDDVDRIRRILTLQRDNYLPLKVIGEVLDDEDAGVNVDLPASRPGAGRDIFEAAPSCDRSELLARTGAPAGLLDHAVQTGLLHAGPRYRADDVTLLRALAVLDRAGVAPRHLRPVKTSAQHEAGLVEQVVQPQLRRGDAASTRQAAERAAEVQGQLAIVRQQLTRAAMRELLGGDER